MDESARILEYPAQPTDDESNAKVVANFSRIEAIKAKHIYVYVVDIRNMDALASDPQEGEEAGKVTDVHVRKSVFERAVSLNSAALDSRPLVFDGQDYAYSAKAAHRKGWGKDASSDSLTLSVDHSLDNVACRMHVTLRKQRRYETKLLYKYCDGDRSVAETYVQGMLFALDSIVRSLALPDTVCVDGRQLCARNAVATKADLGADLYWEYKYTVRPGRGLLSVNIGQRVVPLVNKKTAEALARAYFAPALAGGGSLDRALGDKDWRDFDAVARGLQVRVDGATRNACTYRVVGVSKEPACQLTMGGMPLASYYREHFGLDSARIGEKLPCLLTADGPPIPLALAAIDGRHVMEPMARWQRTHMMALGYLAPTDRHRVLTWGANALANGTGPAADIFGVRVSAELLAVEAQVLRPPQLLMSGKKPVDVSPTSGKWDAPHVSDGKRLASWAVLVLGCSKQAMPEPLVRAFVAQLVKVGQDRGIDMRNTSPPIKYAAASSEHAVAEAASLARTSSGEEAQLVLCILPRYSVRLYGELKRVALTLVGVQTQCVVAGHVRAHTPTLLSMVALKINVKLGGSTVALAANDSVAALNDKEPTLVISADVSHTTEAQCMSVAAIVGSLDLQALRFQGTVVQHPKRMEYIENFDVIVRQCLRLFYRSSGKKPTRIVYYRDGVNDSQMRCVKDLELRAIYHGCALIHPDYRPSVTMVLARKRHSARFIIPGKTYENPVPGTMVSQLIPSPTIFSFYLCAHQPEIGVLRPTCYYVLHDDAAFAPHTLRSLTYNLCYTYPIICRSATMPAPLYYAHRLSGKGRLLLNRSFDDLPFFDKVLQNTKQVKKKKTQAKSDPPHLVSVHRNVQDSMYFM
ncbi:hypothetical protein GGI23_003787 [Coemansia sp. RSA 2559]|nr:hypothetical protein GGI23_003787 [Coemansia sp. RSA 2559]KAJ2860957.1 hypothetical protein GGI22_002574 [Coemansia erecta]